MRFVRQTVMNNLAASGNVAGNYMPAEYLYSASVQAEMVGTAAGTLKLQASNDPVQVGTSGAPLGITAPVNWSDIPAASAAISGTGTVLIPATQLSYSYIRATYTSTSGTGNITANVNAFGF